MHKGYKASRLGKINNKEDSPLEKGVPQNSEVDAFRPWGPRVSISLHYIIPVCTFYLQETSP